MCEIRKVTDCKISTSTLEIKQTVLSTEITRKFKKKIVKTERGALLNAKELQLIALVKASELELAASAKVSKIVMWSDGSS